MSNITANSLLPALLAETGQSRITPISAQRRSLLAGSAALALTGKAGLVSSVIFGASSASAANAVIYVSVKSGTWTSFTPTGKATHEFSISTATTIKLKKHVWIMVRKKSPAGKPFGLFLDADTKDAIFFQDLVVSNTFLPDSAAPVVSFSFSTKTTDSDYTNASDTGELRRSLQVAWSFPSVATEKTYYDISDTDCTETICNGCSYRDAAGVYWLKYVYRTVNSVGTWATSSVFTVKGDQRTKLISAFLDAQEKAKSLRVSQSLALATAALTAGTIAAGLAVTVILEENVPYWVMGIGLYTMYQKGVDVTSARATAMYAASTAAYKLVSMAQEYSSPAR